MSVACLVPFLRHTDITILPFCLWINSLRNHKNKVTLKSTCDPFEPHGRSSLGLGGGRRDWFHRWIFLRYWHWRAVRYLKWLSRSLQITVFDRSHTLHISLFHWSCGCMLYCSQNSIIFYAMSVRTWSQITLNNTSAGTWQYKPLFRHFFRSF